MARDPNIGEVTEAARPAVSPPFVPVVIDSDTLQFRIGPWAGPVLTIRDRDMDGRLRDLLGLLDGNHTFAEILEEFEQDQRDEIRKIVTRLYEENALVDASESENRFLGGYVSSNPVFSVEETPELVSDRILVITNGTIGPIVIQDLVSVGAEEIAVLEPTGTLGAVDELVEMNDRVQRVADPTSLGTEIESAEYVVYTEDSPNPDVISEVNEAAFEARVPWVSGRIHGLDGFVGPMVLPGRTSCYECFRVRQSSNIEGLAGYQVFELHRPGRSSCEPQVPALAHIIAGYLTIDFLYLISNGVGFTAETVIHFDFFDLTIEQNSVLRLPRCRICGSAGRSRLDWQRFVDLERFLGQSSQ